MKKYVYTLCKRLSPDQLLDKFDLCNFSNNINDLNTLSDVLIKLGIDVEAFNLFKTQITIKVREAEAEHLSFVSSKYYDGNDRMISKMILQEGQGYNIFDEFKGEIYEDLNFIKSEEELKTFKKDNNFNDSINSNTLSFYHFKIREINNEKYKDYNTILGLTTKNGNFSERTKEALSIQFNKCFEETSIYFVKERRFIKVYIDNIPKLEVIESSNESFSESDIMTANNLLTCLQKETGLKSKAADYIRAALFQQRANVISRGDGFKPTSEIVDEKTREILIGCIDGLKKDLILKIKLITDERPNFENNKNLNNQKLLNKII